MDDRDGRGGPRTAVGDRGFPSRPLFQTLRALGWGRMMRLRAPGTRLRVLVTLAGARRAVRALLADATAGRWRVWEQAQFGGGKGAVPAMLVVWRVLLVLPRHQRGPGSLAARARRRGVAGSSERLGEPVLACADPDGLALELSASLAGEARPLARFLLALARFLQAIEGRASRVAGR